MSRETRYVPLYQRLNAGGTPTHKLAGISATLKAGDDAAKEQATWLVRADDLNGLAPAIGDFIRDTAGRWWQAKGIGAPVGGDYPLLCDRWKEGS